MAKTKRNSQPKMSSHAASDEFRNGCYTRGPQESIPAWTVRMRRQARQEAAAAGMRLMPEPCNILSDREQRAKAAEILNAAKTLARGMWAPVMLSFSPPILITVDFDGEGGVWINENAYLTQAGSNFANLLHSLGNDKIHDGVLDGCEHPPLMFGME